MASGPLLHDVVKPLAWLLGKWRGEGKGIYPTIKDFTYTEELEFFHVGQPMLQFSSYSFHPEKKTPIHRETGFLRIQPGTNNIAMIIAHNNGVCEMEEGVLTGHEIKLESHTVGRMSFGKPPETKKISRKITLDGDTLTQVLLMETENTKLTEHLRTTYKKAT